VHVHRFDRGLRREQTLGVDHLVDLLVLGATVQPA
jgi:hypothetical protein